MMLQVNCPQARKVKDKIDGLQLEGITYHVKNLHALIIDVTFEGGEIDTAKNLLRKYIAALPEMRQMFLSIKVAYDNGQLV